MLTNQVINWLLVINNQPPFTNQLINQPAFANQLFYVSLQPNVEVMLQKTFSIYADNLDDCRLFIEAGSHHIACWCKDAETGAAKAFEFFQFDEGPGNGIDNILKEVRLHSRLMDLPLTPDAVIWDTEEVLYIPAVFYKEQLAPEYLSMMFGEAETNEVLAQQSGDYVILSRQQAAYITTFKAHFAVTTFSHKFFGLLQQYMKDAEQAGANQLHVIFYPSHFILTALKDKKLQVMRSINYSTAEDALYSIIHICNEYGMPLNTTAITASGLIDTSSNLYNTLYSYLETFTLQKSESVVFGAEGFAEYPAHFFLPFIQ